MGGCLGVWGWGDGYGRGLGGWVWKAVEVEGGLL